MKRRASADLGFWMAFILNLFFQSEWLVLALIFLGLHHLFALPLFLFWAALVIWVLIALFITAFLGWVSSGPDRNAVQGQRTSERLRRKKEESEEK
ncbi:MAG: hypothetical protein Q4C06_08700 [Bacillota bacterium]|nr:hypothetical protein [Bacillota bacterium]